MIDVVVVGGTELTVRAVALAGLGSDGVPRIMAIDGSGALGGSTSPRSVSRTAAEAIVLGGKTKTVDVGMAVGINPSGNLGFVNLDTNGNAKTV